MIFNYHKSGPYSPLLIMMMVLLCALLQHFWWRFDLGIIALFSAQSLVFAGVVLAVLKNILDLLERIHFRGIPLEKDRKNFEGPTAYWFVGLSALFLFAGMLLAPLGPAVVVVRLQDARDKYREMNDWVRRQTDLRLPLCKVTTGQKFEIKSMTHSSKNYILKLARYSDYLVPSPMFPEEETALASSCSLLRLLLRDKCQGERAFQPCNNLKSVVLVSQMDNSRAHSTAYTVDQQC